MTTLAIPQALREAIARAILEDEGNPNGEHLFDGERVLFYCPMQGHGLPPDGRPRVPVRELLPPGLTVPAFGDYLAGACPGVQLTELTAAARAQLQQDYEAAAVHRLATALPDRVTLQGPGRASTP